MSIELDPSKDWGLVAYSDGGARPNPGASGCGLHAYLYEIEKLDGVPTLTTDEANNKVRYLLSAYPDIRNIINETPKTELLEKLYDKRYLMASAKIKPLKFTDGETIRYAFMSNMGYLYCSKDGAPSSTVNKAACAVDPKYIVSIVESSSNQHTNNYAEMKSLLNGLQLGIKHQVKRLHLITDSEYTLKGLNSWVPLWIKNNWTTGKGEPVKNQELWELLWNTLNEAKASGMTVTTSWVKGHHNHPGNFNADHLATIGVMRSTKSEDNLDIRYYTVKEYLEPKRERSPLLSLKRMYFNRVEDRNTTGVYYMADPGKDDALIGKPLPETVFAVVRMKEPVELIQSIWDAQARYGQDFNATMMLKMDNVYEPYAYHLLSEYKDKALLRAPKGSHVILPDQRQITIERNPVGITMRAIDSLNSLEQILDIFTELRKPSPDLLVNNVHLQIHDVTAELYETSEKKVQGEIVLKKTMRKEIVVGQKSFSITRDVETAKETKTITFPLRLGADMPDRNSLKRLETSDPIVSLITWRESENSLRYAAVLECEEGTAIWSNYYADRLMFKE